MTTADRSQEPGTPSNDSGPRSSPGRRRATSARSTAGNLLTRLVVLPMVVVTGVLVSRELGTSGRGVYAYLMLPGAVWLPMLSMGFGASVIYFVSSKQHSSGDLFGASMLVALTQGLVTAALIGLLWHLGTLGTIGQSVEPWHMIAALSMLPLQSMTLMLTRLLQGDSQFGICNGLSIFQQLLTSSCLIVLVVVCGYGVAGAVTSMLISSAVMVAITMVTTTLVVHPTWRVRRVHLNAGLRYGARAWPGDVATRANARIDQLILSTFVDASSLGLYATAVTVSELIWMIPDSLSFVLFNKVAAAKSPQVRAELTEQTHRIVFWCMVVLACLLAVASPWLITSLYGRPFERATVPLLILLPGVVLMVTPKSLTKFLGASGMPGKSSTMVIIGGAACSLLSLGLVPLFHELGTDGIYGAALASTLGYAACAVSGIWLYQGVAGTRWSHLWSRLYVPSRTDLTWLWAQMRSGILNRPHKPQ